MESILEQRNLAAGQWSQFDLGEETGYLDAHSESLSGLSEVEEQQYREQENRMTVEALKSWLPPKFEVGMRFMTAGAGEVEVTEAVDNGAFLQSKSDWWGYSNGDPVPPSVSASTAAEWELVSYLGRINEELESPAALPSDELGVNPKDLQGAKKPMLDLVPPSSIIYQALAMEDGARKYGPFNWRETKVKASIYVAACKRHLDAWFDSHEELASDSKRPHLGHAIACIGILIDALECGSLYDDRPLPGAAGQLIAKWERIKREELESASNSNNGGNPIDV